MLALHGSQTVGGAQVRSALYTSLYRRSYKRLTRRSQFYIGCAQLKVTGPGGTCSPKISLPGAYNAQDSNIYIPNFYYGFDPSTYTAPGGAVATCGGSGASNPTTATTTTSTARTTSTSAAGSSTLTTVTTRTSTSAAATSTSAAAGTVPLYGQCGGTGYTGLTTCVAGATCVKYNDCRSSAHAIYFLALSSLLVSGRVLTTRYSDFSQCVAS